jgi:hypothetical protein
VCVICETPCVRARVGLCVWRVEAANAASIHLRQEMELAVSVYIHKATVRPHLNNEVGTS